MRIRLKITTVFIALAISLTVPKTLAASLDLLPDDPAKMENLLNRTVETRIKRGAYFLLGIESKINDSREELALLKNNIRSLKDKIDETNVRMEDLQSQIQNLDRLIDENRRKIQAGELQAAEYENQIIISEQDIKDKEEQIGKQFKSLDLALNAYYLQNNSFFDSKNNAPMLLAFLASDASTGEIIKQNQYLFFLQNASQELIKRIQKNELEIQEQKIELQGRKNKLQELQIVLAREKRTLEASQESKNKLLEETKGKQIIYETLLELSKKEEQQVSAAIETLKQNYVFFQTKIEELGATPALPNNDSDTLSLDTDLSEQILKGTELLAWPVNPNLGISAFFKDSAYEKALGLPHNAIDIKIPQSSRVKTAADGVITKVADNGYAYSYVIIGHAGNIMTLYGHLSEIFVKEGEIVRQGQTIGLSGGIPGTKGAGWLTTGAHLHFEVFKNFKHTDPLEYLPLEYLPLKSLAEKYLQRLTGNEEKKIKRLQLIE